MKALLTVVLIAAVAAFAWQALPRLDPAPSAAGTAMAALGKGIVQRIDEAAGEVTIRHGPIPALDMMAMTMSFRVRDPDQLAELRPQQEVEFHLSFDGRDYVITDIR
jgi:Cu(I)/Ag(I) efflux system periplasmic protein CusF